jgi:hypothetical protein
MQELLGGDDKARIERVTQPFLKMKKFDCRAQASGRGLSDPSGFFHEEGDYMDRGTAFGRRATARSTLGQISSRSSATTAQLKYA